ncbi:MAG: hypothetical protein IKL73_06200 [Lachnospiraceae bacterium]|nr:hypothetical protein [Lachnospiraceae bacterium]
MKGIKQALVDKLNAKAELKVSRVVNEWPPICMGLLNQPKRPEMVQEEKK